MPVCAYNGDLLLFCLLLFASMGKYGPPWKNVISIAGAVLDLQRIGVILIENDDFVAA